MKLICGTSGFSYDDWVATFYPAAIKKSEMLNSYSEFFKAVELNVSYYRIPATSSFEKMNQKTPDDFEFIVKVNQETTHRRNENKQAVKSLLEAVKPLEKNNKLAGLLAQFPYSFYNNEQNRKYLLQTKEYIGELPVFVEFRNDSWVNEAIPAFLKANAIGYVNVDEPKLKGLLPPQDITTIDIGYIRFHGRHKEKWWEGKGSERYEYNYTNEELQSWLIRVSEIMKKSYKSYVFFNNHPKGNAPANAMTFDKMMQQYLGE